MKRMNKIVLVSLVCMLLVGALAMLTSAKTYTGTKYGYKNHYIYVKTGDFDNGTPKLKMNCYQGTIQSCEIVYNSNKDDPEYDCYWYYNYGNIANDKYASYELKIRYWDGSKYVMEDNYDVYDKSTHTIKFKRENTDYQIQVYQWRADTTLKSYLNKRKLSKFNRLSHYIDGAFWSKLPKFATSTKTNCTELSKNPH